MNPINKRTITVLTVIAVLTFTPVFALANQVIYVNLNATGSAIGDSWQNAFTSITEAISASTSGDEIWVAQGRYLESITMKEGISLFGGFSGVEVVRNHRNWTVYETIIDADGLDTSTVKIENLDEALLDGFTVTGGGASYSGGGVYIQNASPAMTNCIIIGNIANHRGGGLVVYSNSAPVLTKCTILNNTASDYGGGVYVHGGSVTLIDCTIGGNSSMRGGGVSLFDGNATLTNCSVIENAGSFGGGVYITGLNSTAIMTRCTINANTITLVGGIGGGIYIQEGSTVTLVDCTINENTSFRGGGITFQNANGTLTNCTIKGNSSGSYGGGISIGDSNVTLTNCSIISNTAYKFGLHDGYGGGISIGSSSNVTIALTNCTISNNYAEGRGGGFSISTGGSPILINCIISGNSAGEEGGGLYIGGGGANPTITNCTISGNTAIRGGGGIHLYYYPSANLTNSILWENSPNPIISSIANITVSWSFVQGGFEGIGNIDGDPRFWQPWDGDSADFRLLPDSPCIDAGDPGILDGCRLPALGAARSDMGAYGGPLNCDWLLTEQFLPDPNFFAAVEEFMGVPTGGAFTIGEAAAKTGTLDCSNRGIVELTGIEYFPAITGLDCSGNQLASLNLSNNQQLNWLDASSNNLTSLSGVVSNSNLGTNVGGWVDVRYNLLDCVDWDGVQTLLARIGESAFAYSPQQGLNPYDCDTPPLLTEQCLDLRTGFQFVSLAIDPTTPNLRDLCDSVISDLHYVRNSSGASLQFAFGQWLNGIGDWNSNEGYLVKMNSPRSLCASGAPVNPQTPIQLSVGFQFIPYFPSSPMNALDAMGSILDDLEFMRDSDGNSLQHAFGQWLNGIGMMAPGQGYLVRMKNSAVLVYPGD